MTNCSPSRDRCIKNKQVFFSPLRAKYVRSCITSVLILCLNSFEAIRSTGILSQLPSLLEPLFTTSRWISAFSGNGQTRRVRLSNSHFYYSNLTADLSRNFSRLNTCKAMSYIDPDALLILVRRIINCHRYLLSGTMEEVEGVENLNIRRQYVISKSVRQKLSFRSITSISFELER